jgi:hypothetical protein
MVLVYVACCYHVYILHVIIAVLTAFLSGAGMKLVFCINVALR